MCRGRAEGERGHIPCYKEQREPRPGWASRKHTREAEHLERQLQKRGKLPFRHVEAGALLERAEHQL